MIVKRLNAWIWIDQPPNRGSAGIAAGAVKTHTLNIYRKLEVANRTQAIVHAQESGLLRA